MPPTYSSYYEFMMYVYYQSIVQYANKHNIILAEAIPNWPLLVDQFNVDKDDVCFFSLTEAEEAHKDCFAYLHDAIRNKPSWAA